MQGTTNVVDELRSRGFTVTCGYVAWAIRDRHIPEPEEKLGAAFIWTEADVDRLRSFLRRQGRGPERAANDRV